MQLITDGPDIPDTLLEAHEEGRVIFFCGAGISYPAGLPGFAGLVENIYKLCNEHPNQQEQQLIESYQYDAALEQLERRFAGQRTALRQRLFQALQFKGKKGAYDSHRALLQLGRDRKGPLRLVTTNFDRIFTRAAKLDNVAVKEYPAPLVPVPKNSHWDGIVYLHGLLPAEAEESELNRLVLTSGDFGLAYLVERWAARFVSELLRNYVVCFVGYSIGDPILRYMMDAIAADRRLGNKTLDAYAFGDCEPGKEADKEREWLAKGVTPILYQVTEDDQAHTKLHGTLKAWAETYRAGVEGREAVVTKNAIAKPESSTQQDDFVGRMLWALSHRSGLPAKRFAEHNPVPAIEWLDAFTANQFKVADLPRFGVAASENNQLKQNFSLARRPTPFTHAPWMGLVSHYREDVQCDDVMTQLGRWLTRHLDNPKLIIWIARHGGQLQSNFAWLIERKMDELVELESKGSLDELQRIRDNAPHAIPCVHMRTLWRLLLAGAVRPTHSSSDLYLWKKRLNRDGGSVMLRQELRELLAPKISIAALYRDESKKQPERISDLVNWELKLNTDHAQTTLEEFRGSEDWQALLPYLVSDAQQLLSDALDLRNELDPHTVDEDYSHWRLPSISRHVQNRDHDDWVALIELLRDAWLAILEQNPEQARTIVHGWLMQPYPTFRRLALFAASKSYIAPDGEWVAWLLDNDHRWLWAGSTRRESLRLLVLQGGNLSRVNQSRLEKAILDGPRKGDNYDGNIEEWQLLADHAVWLRLAKLASSGCKLSDDAKEHFSLLQLEHLHWKLASDESDEFSIWSGRTGDEGFSWHDNVEAAPRSLTDLIDWLQKRPASDNDWSDICRQDFALCSDALCTLAHQNYWPARYWREGLQAWSQDQFAVDSWSRLATPIIDMPDDTLLDVANSLAWWLKTIAGSITEQEDAFFQLCRRMLALASQLKDGVPTEEPVTRAINHPIGHITQALLSYLFKSQPKDNDTLPSPIHQLFTELCDPKQAQYRHSRVLLSSRQIALFRIDREWTTTHLLPLLNWQQANPEAPALWQGYLWAPRLYRPLISAYKTAFLETAQHYNLLSEYGQQYARILTFAALEPADTFTPKELRVAISALPNTGLRTVADALTQALKGAGDQREAYWKEKIEPFWQSLWPKEQERITIGIAEELVQLAIAACRQFPDAIEMLKDWLVALRHSDYIIMELAKSGLCSDYPGESLDLLYRIVDQSDRAPLELDLCLRDILGAAPRLNRNPELVSLANFARQQGQVIHLRNHTEEALQY